MTAVLPIEHGLAALLVVAAPVRGYFRARALKATGGDGKRLGFYRRTVAMAWTVSLAALGLFHWAGRPLALLGLGWPEDPLRAALVCTLALVFSVRLVQRSRQLGLHVEALPPRALENFAKIRFILPHDPAELRWFAAVSVTAGVCEELLFRGWLLWYFSELVPYPLALALSLAAFGLGHAYQGPRGIVLTSVLGAVLLAIYLVAGTLWPAMLFHAAFDAANGLLGYAVARRTLAPPAPPAA